MIGPAPRIAPARPPAAFQLPKRRGALPNHKDVWLESQDLISGQAEAPRSVGGTHRARQERYRRPGRARRLLRHGRAVAKLIPADPGFYVSGLLAPHCAEAP